MVLATETATMQTFPVVVLVIDVVTLWWQLIVGGDGGEEIDDGVNVNAKGENSLKLNLCSSRDAIFFSFQ